MFKTFQKNPNSVVWTVTLNWHEICISLVKPCQCRYSLKNNNNNYINYSKLKYPVAKKKMPFVIFTKSQLTMWPYKHSHTHTSWENIWPDMEVTVLTIPVLKRTTVGQEQHHIVIWINKFLLSSNWNTKWLAFINWIDFLLWSFFRCIDGGQRARWNFWMEVVVVE